jgi:hypothetical protein
MARAAPGWGLLVRRPANFPLMTHFDYFEGIVEPELRFGPLFINLRFTKTDAPIRLCADLPLAQIQPIPRWLYGDEVLDGMRVTADGLDEFSNLEWDDYMQAFSARNATSGRPGLYSVEARRRRKQTSGITMG